MTLENISEQLKQLNSRLFDETIELQEALLENEKEDFHKLYSKMTSTLEEIQLHHKYLQNIYILN